MKYVFDTNSLIVLFDNFYLDRFPSLWERFDSLLSTKRILLVREVYNEIIEYQGKKSRLVQWSKDNRELFLQPSTEEMKFVNQIFLINHFRDLIRKRQTLEGKPVADPFLISKAKIENSCLVTEESYKKNAARIPNVCEHFGIHCTNLEGFMEIEGWQF